MEFGNKLADFLRQGADTLVNLPTEAQRFITNPQAFTELVTGKNPLPKETGFVAGASGLPPKNPAQGGVLNPASAPYQEGYEQGEPVAIASMALPAYASALRAGAPKAYNALENYMVKSGGMIPLEAYHGTPHKIEGGFDISKVGTGEGAQSYGHGMYFAEAKPVAEGYKTALSNVEMSAKGQPLTAFGVDERVATHSPNIFKNPLDYGLAEYNKSLKTQLLDYPELKNDPNYAKELFDQRVEFLKSWGKGSKEAQAGEALENFAKTNGYPDVNMSGNLYKVDIPDEHIPNMLDWDKPLSQQPKAVQDALAKLDPDLYSPKGMDYDPTERGQWIYMRLAGDTTQKNASNKLNEFGVKGINYLDAGSRSKGGTSNFVVFDPSTVKILEENGKPVARKELLKKQVDKLK